MKKRNRGSVSIVTKTPACAKSVQLATINLVKSVIHAVIVWLCAKNVKRVDNASKHVPIPHVLRVANVKKNVTMIHVLTVESARWSVQITHAQRAGDVS